PVVGAARWRTTLMSTMERLSFSNLLSPARILLIAVVLGLVTCPQSPAAAAERLNVLVILVDDLGYGDLSCYGATDLQSPHIDRLASEGMTFTNFYANCPVCSPTRAALLTGRYQDMVGVPGVIRTHADNSWGWLSPDAVLLPKTLKAAGYHSAIIGKWHLGLTEPKIGRASCRERG